MIDQNIVLDIFNPDERMMYNPSEVSITSGAFDLHFPSHYCFKTVRGIYPTTAEVLAANTAENGGPYSDPCDVPVPTDLSPVQGEPWLASVYNLESGSKLTFEPCLTVYDASFYLLTGSMLVIENADLLYGKHRHRIFNQGGHLLTRNQDIWLQNENILAGQHFSYEGKHEIEAGRQVTPSLPTGDYEIESGGIVNLTAESEIHLSDGFHAAEGSDFHAGIDQVTLLYCPPLRPAAPMDSSPKFNPHTSFDDNEFTAFPNPSAGVFTLRASDNSTVMRSIAVYDLYGHCLQTLRSSRAETTLDLRSCSAGVYFVKIVTGEQVHVVKMAVDK